jgi:hypothetical protein
MRAGTVRRDRLERISREYKFRLKLCLKYNYIPDDLSGLFPEFCKSMMAEMPKEDIAKFLADINHCYDESSYRRTLRCLIFGCESTGHCDYYPYCQECAGRCWRCGNTVLPKAKIKRS